ncbi:unnamed protein product [Vitrella brassicaformis CCMP3155]|uniref:phosphoribosylglycinamide formyltransferase 1 n=1 Tax=Vitrella brassicaformis (strain CCMP3155) TaxID=1169540 RepID=A0A0G4H6X0_VITBC|nr:unnamed protein product [Vitrella brassicaformis CCMP3155]|eukprot:CEM39602.1 unnamed protein product [Vitrella brassicaformis CCMP3155]
MGSDENPLPRVLVFASGTKDGGGSGFEKLVENARAGKLRAEIVGVVSNHSDGGVKQRADRLGVPFKHFPLPRNGETYAALLREFRAEWVALSGWLKLVCVRNDEKGTPGVDPARTINIHPGLLPRFGGAGMYGHHVHQAVYEAYQKAEVTEAGCTMHFVTEKYDDGPTIFRTTVPLTPDDTPDTIAAKVNALEHEYQSYVTDLVVNGEISWDGKSRDSLRVPPGYKFL